MQMWVERYYNDIEKYKKQLIKGKIIHRYGDGFDPDELDRRRYINQVRVPEFRDKIKYFLEHEDERLEIAARGELKHGSIIVTPSSREKL